MLIKQVKEANVCLLFLLSGGAANPINHSTDLAHHLLQQWRPSGNRRDSCYDYDCGSDDERRLIAAAAVNCCYRVWMAADDSELGGFVLAEEDLDEGCVDVYIIIRNGRKRKQHLACRRCRIDTGGWTLCGGLK